MKFSITMHAARGKRKHAITLPLRLDILRALGFAPGAPCTAIVDRGVMILCPSEDAEAWEALLTDFPASLVGLVEVMPARHIRPDRPENRGYSDTTPPEKIDPEPS